MTRKTELLLVGLLLAVTALTAAGLQPSVALAQLPMPAGPLEAGVILINEVLAHTDPPQLDSIELFNRTTEPIHLDGWCITDNADQPCRTCLSGGLVVPPSGFLVITEKKLDFRLSEMGEDVLLSRGASCTATELVDRVEFDASPNGVSMGRYVVSNGRSYFPLQRALTLGAPNVGPIEPVLVLAELLVTPPAGGHEYVEVYNPGREAVRLYDPEHPLNLWELDGISGHEMPQIALPAGGSIYFTSSTPAAFRAAMGLPAEALVVQYAGSLRDGGERIKLMRPEAPNANDGLVPYVVVDEVGSRDFWPWSGGGPHARTNLTAFGQEPQAWGSPTIALASGPTISGLSMSVGPGGIEGATVKRIVRWSTAREWRTATFFVTIEKLDTAGATVESAAAELSAPAMGSRHRAASYAVVQTGADPAATYRYTLRVRWWDGSEQVLKTMTDGPESRVYMPAVAR